MLTAREAAANAFIRTRGMSRHVRGFSGEQVEELRRFRVERLQDAVRYVRAAVGTPQILVSEWTDDDLQQAAAALEAQLATETAQLADPGAVGGCQSGSAFPGVGGDLPMSAPGPGPAAP